MWTWFLSATLLLYFLWPAQVCTPVAGGRWAGSSLMRRPIPPDYVPHVRVHSGEKNFHLVRRTHTYFILHSDPRSSPPPPSVWVISQKKQKKKTTKVIFTSAPKWTPASSSVKLDSQLAAGSGVKAGAGLWWEMVVGQYQGHQVSVLNADYWTHRPHSKMVVLVRFLPAALQVGRWNMKL